MKKVERPDVVEMKKRPTPEDLAPITAKALRYWDPCRGSRRMRVKVAKRDRKRGGTLRDLLRIESATIRIMGFLDEIDEGEREAEIAIDDPERLLALARQGAAR